jgi:hypothetical protein
VIVFLEMLSSLEVSSYKDSLPTQSENQILKIALCLNARFGPNLIGLPVPELERVINGPLPREDEMARKK